MSYTADQIKEILQAGESEVVEFKQSLRDRDMLATLMAAFANTRGGTIIIGVTEPTTIVGADIVRVQRLFHEAQTVLQPAVNSEIDTIEVDGKNIAVIRIEPATRLVLANTGAYQRVNTLLTPMTPAAIARTLARSDHGDKNEGGLMPPSEQRSNITDSIAFEASSILTASGTATSDSIAIGIANLTKEVSDLKAHLSEATGWQAQWENYLVGGVVGGLLGLAFTNNVSATVAVIVVALVVIIRVVHSYLRNKKMP
ncbi:ATP-binding protein [Chloroflexales bacterium ZM16-3]|nr:ATP-binding protein [Chloroflexales bacterium ZM16-3]